MKCFAVKCQDQRADLGNRIGPVCESFPSDGNNSAADTDRLSANQAWQSRVIVWNVAEVKPEEREMAFFGGGGHATAVLSVLD